jgi:hypothetical protein
LWLNPVLTNVNAISELLNPYDARLMRCYPVSTRINHVENDDEESADQWGLLKFRKTISVGVSFLLVLLADAARVFHRAKIVVQYREDSTCP